MNRFKITRQYKFEMSHALFMQDTNSNTNLGYYSRDIKPHGHNWKLEITVEGTKDIRSHMIYDLNNLDKLVAREINARYDHQHFDSDNFDQVPTLENLTKVMWDTLKQKDNYVSQIQLYEEPYIYATYLGGNNMYVTHTYNFNAQHRTFNPKIAIALNDQYYGKCRNWHGHSYELSVTLKGGRDEKTGLVVDRVRFDIVMDQFMEDHLGHKNLNELPGLEEGNATTENLLEALWPKIESVLRDREVTNKDNPKLYRLRIKETDRNYFDYHGPNKEEIF